MNIPQRWLDVLSALQSAGFTEAFIGGGALRDLDHDRPIKDVDIFVRDRAGCAHGVLMATLPELTIYDKTEFHSEYAINFPDVAGVYEAFESVLGGAPYNIIACNGPAGDTAFRRHHLSRFDLGICHIMFDGTLRTMDTHYVTDAANRTITLVNPVNVGHSIKRALRIRDRAYQDWKVKGIPAELGVGAFNFPNVI